MFTPGMKRIEYFQQFYFFSVFRVFRGEFISLFNSLPLSELYVLRVGGRQIKFKMTYQKNDGAKRLPQIFNFQ